MEDAATAEISRSQLWQWIRHGAGLDGGGTMSATAYRNTRDRVLSALTPQGAEGNRYGDAAALLDELVLGPFQEFLTVPGYRMLDGRGT